MTGDCNDTDDAMVGDERSELADGYQQVAERLPLRMMDEAATETIEIHAEYDVSDLSYEDTAVLKALAAMVEDNFTEIAEKNRDYSWSFLTTGAKLANSNGSPFETAPRSQVFGLLTRAGDKRERLIENVYGDGSAKVSDDPHVTAREAANYWLFIAFILEHPDLAASVGGER